jgi:hypothetical protein
MRVQKNEIESPFLGAFIEYAQQIAGAEGLGEWTLDLWSCEGEGVCEENKKIIRFGLCTTLFRTKHLFLHEVAHALCSKGRKDPSWDDSYWHRRPWQEIFARLLMDHLPDWYWAYMYRKTDN